MLDGTAAGLFSARELADEARQMKLANEQRMCEGVCGGLWGGDRQLAQFTCLSVQDQQVVVLAFGPDLPHHPPPPLCLFYAASHTPCPPIHCFPPAGPLLPCSHCSPTP